MKREVKSEVIEMVSAIAAARATNANDQIQGYKV